MSSQSMVWEHKPLEQKDSGFESDSSFSPFSRVSSSENGSDTERSKRIKIHRRLERTVSVQCPVDPSNGSTTAASIIRTPSADGASSCVSMGSNISKHHPPGFKPAPSGDKLLQAPESSALSFKSDKSMELVGNLEVRTPNSRPYRLGEERADSDQDSLDSMETFPGRQEDDTSFDSLSSNYSDADQSTDSLLPEPSEVSSLRGAMEKLKEEYKNKLKLTFLKPEKCTILLNDIYIKPDITEEEAVSEEETEISFHETRELKAAPRTARLNMFPANWNFDQPPEEQRKIKTVLTKGIPGIGKTVCLQKFVLDWAEGKTHQEIDVILALSLQDLNQKKDKRISLTDLLQHFFPQIKQIQLNTVRVMLILDGLDEYRLPLDFQHNPNCSDPNQPTAVDVLLTNLIKGNLLPSARLWITSRPGTASVIPSEYLQRVTEIQGFRDAQREEYFYKRISDKTKARTIISHINTSEYLHRVSHIPAYCSLLVAVLQETLDNTRAPLRLEEIVKCSLRANLHSKEHTE